MLFAVHHAIICANNEWACHDRAVYVAIITVCKKFIEKHPQRMEHTNMLFAIQVSNNVASKVKKVCQIITKSIAMCI